MYDDEARPMCSTIGFRQESRVLITDASADIFSLADIFTLVMSTIKPLIKF